MYDYRAPLKDTNFVYKDLFGFLEHYASLPGSEDISEDLFDSVIQEIAKFAENEVAPLNQIGDEIGCQWEEGNVTTPPGFKQAWEKFRDAGWQGLSFHPEEGGQGLPASIRIISNEYFGTASWSWLSLLLFGEAGSASLRAHGSDYLRDKIIPIYASGEALGTMCLTEPHCGTDLGMMRTKAVPNADGSYSITGTKIFITSGEHDLTENIIHLVLAKTPDAPKGTKGISLFIVPKLHLEGDDAGKPNGVSCGSIEHKMGIKGSSTCVMNFDNARGLIVGEENRGLPAMFPMMNAARIGTGVQGLCHTELGFQKSVGYAKDRLQMRALTGPKNPDGPADPIIVHPDVRRMLLTQKAFAEGGRMLVAYCAKLVDINQRHPDEDIRKSADQQLGFLTPIVKAFMTETGFESANLGMQCFGGHGYVREWGVEQNVRDARIAMLYEGTTGIQALDLLGRKVLGSQGKAAMPLFAEITQFCAANSDNEFVKDLAPFLSGVQGDIAKLGRKALSDPEEVGAASVDFLMYLGYIVYGYLWARAAVVASEKLKDQNNDTAFYESKLKTARFFFDRLLPRANGHAVTMHSGAGNLMAMDQDQFLAHI